MLARCCLLLLHLCFCWGPGTEMAPAGSRVPREASPGRLPLCDSSKKGTSSPSPVPQALFRWLFPCSLPPRCLPALSPEAGRRPQGSRPAKPTCFSNSRLEVPLPARPHENQPLSFSQRMALGKCSPCGFPCVLLSLSLSLASLIVAPSPPEQS